MAEKEVILSNLNHKILKKTILKHGVYSMGCNDGFTCQFKISDIIYEDENSSPVPSEQRISIFREEGVQEVQVGGASSHIDMDFHRVLKHMFYNETSVVSIQYNNKEDVMKLRISAKITIMNIKSSLSESISSTVSDWDWKTKVLVASRYKQDGVDSMKSDVTLAFRAFSQALKLLLSLVPSDYEEIDEDDVKTINDHKVKLYNNLALCQMRYKQFSSVLNLCNKALEIDPENEKSLFRRAVAYNELSDYEAAYADVLKVLQMSPDNVDAKRLAGDLKGKVKCINDSYKKVIKNMFA